MTPRVAAPQRQLPPRRAWLPLLLAGLPACVRASAILPWEPPSPRQLALEEEGRRVHDVADSVSSSLSQLAPREQQRVLAALACEAALDGGGDAVLRAACAAAYDDDAPFGDDASTLLDRQAAWAQQQQQQQQQGQEPGQQRLRGRLLGGGGGPVTYEPGKCPYKDDSTVHHVNREHIELMVIAVVMITVLIEVGTHHIDHSVNGKGTEHIFQIVQRVYKELMLLGIISFALFFFESSACLAPEVAHELHIIHILIFFISIAYIAEAFFILYVAALVARRWNKLERITLVQYAGYKLHLAALTERLQQRNTLELLLYPSSWYLMYRQHNIRSAAAYQDARLQFVSCNRLPHDFAFNVYLRKCIRQVFVDLIHIHWGIWLAVAMLVQLDLSIHTSFVRPAMQEAAASTSTSSTSTSTYGRMLAASSSSSTSSSSSSLDSPIEFIDYCMVAGIVFTIWLALIYYKVIRVQENCFKSDLMEFNVWEELKWMMAQQKMEKQKTDHKGKKEKLGKLAAPPKGSTPRSGNGANGAGANGASPSRRTPFGGSQRARVGDTSFAVGRGSTLMQWVKDKVGAPSDALPGSLPARRSSDRKSTRRSRNGGGVLAPFRNTCRGNKSPLGTIAENGGPGTDDDEDALMNVLSSMAAQQDNAVVEHVQRVRRGTLLHPGGGMDGQQRTSQKGAAGADGNNGSSSHHHAGNRSPIGGGGSSMQRPARQRRMGSNPGVDMAKSGGHLRRGSIIVGNKAAISPQEYLEHVDAVRTAWRYAAAQTIHDIRLAKRMKKQKKYGHFAIEHWGRTSRVFEKFFWFHSHMFIQYFLQGAVFCTSIYFAAIMQFGEQYLFTSDNFEGRLPSVILLFASFAAVVLLGLFVLVPAILMQYTMVMHLAQLHAPTVVSDAVEEAKKENDRLKAKHAKHEEMKKSGAKQASWLQTHLLDKLTWENYDETVNGKRVLYFFLTLLLVEFFISVLSSVVRQDVADYCFSECILDCLVHFGDALPGAIYQHLEANCTVGGASSSYGSSGGYSSGSNDTALEAFQLEQVISMNEIADGLEIADIVLAFCLVLDVLMRAACDPKAFLMSPWDLFDACIVIAYAVIAPLTFGGGDSSRNLVLLLRVLRLLRFHRFVYAMTASSDQDGSGFSRRERLVNCCRRHICCKRWRLEDDAAEEWKPPPRDALLEDDPIAAMKAKRAAARAAGATGAPSGSGLTTPPRGSPYAPGTAAPAGALGPATPQEMLMCSA